MRGWVMGSFRAVRVGNRERIIPHTRNPSVSLGIALSLSPNAVPLISALRLLAASGAPRLTAVMERLVPRATTRDEGSRPPSAPPLYCSAPGGPAAAGNSTMAAAAAGGGSASLSQERRALPGSESSLSLIMPDGMAMGTSALFSASAEGGGASEALGKDVPDAFAADDRILAALETELREGRGFLTPSKSSHDPPHGDASASAAEDKAQPMRLIVPAEDVHSVVSPAEQSKVAQKDRDGWTGLWNGVVGSVGAFFSKPSAAAASTQTDGPSSSSPSASSPSSSSSAQQKDDGGWFGWFTNK